MIARRVRRGLALGAVGVLSTLPAHAGTVHPATSWADPPPVDLRLDEVEPGWVTGGREVSLTASVHTTDESVSDVRVTLSTSDVVTDRDGVTEWLEQGRGARHRVRSESVGSVGSDTHRSLDLTLPTAPSDRPVVLPVSVAVSGTVDGEREVLDVQRTVVPVLPEAGSPERPTTPTTRVGWLLGVTAPLSSEQFSSSTEQRTGAWTEAVGDSPSVDAAATLGDEVTPAVDPALVPHLDEELSAEVLSPEDGLWRLSRFGVDPAAVHRDDTALWERATKPTDAVDGPLLLDLSSAEGRRGSSDAELRRLVSRTPEDTVVLAPAGFRDEGTSSGKGAEEDPGNWWNRRRVGWVDQGLSHHLASPRDPSSGDETGRAVPGQALLGLTLLPGDVPDPDRPRDVVAAPDPTRVDGEALADALELAGKAPWLESLPASELLSCTASSCPTGPGEGTARWPAITDEGTPREVEPLGSLVDNARALASVTTGSQQDLLQDAPVALLSDAWTQPWQRQRALEQAEQTHDDLLGALDVEDSTVNLLADSAELRATVANSSTTTFEDLRVVVSPGNYRVTADQPEDTLQLGPGGRASTSFTAQAHAVGQVPVRILVTTPDGEQVLARGEVTVHARPADGWWYTGIGIVTALLIGFGAWRTVRQVRSGAPPSPSETGDPA